MYRCLIVTLVCSCVVYSPLYAQQRIISDPPQLVCHADGVEFALDVIGGVMWLSKKEIRQANDAALVLTTTRTEPLYVTRNTETPTGDFGYEMHPSYYASATYQVQNGWAIRAAYAKDGVDLEFQVNVTSPSSYDSDTALQMQDARFSAKIGLRLYNRPNQYGILPPFEWLTEQADCRRLGSPYVPPKKSAARRTFEQLLTTLR